ncbi:MAG TPA: dockerin type I domain-containing protein, partial [Candidatus Kryptonia bacterium]|nr:dockerin type I domain-containing protein [Candidatus Kryptonia bacterium]
MRYTWRSKLIAFATALVLAGTAPVARAVCGDVNSNGTVDIGDAIALAAKIASATACTTPADCDVLKDGTVDIKDLTNLVAQIAGLKTLYAACTGPGADVACADGTDADTGKPIHIIPATTISANQTWPDTCTIHITGIVYIADKTVVRIKPGTVVKGIGTGTVNPAVLIFLPGSKIDAQGTPQQPIIMTSGQPVGSRQIGDWGGLLLNGKSTVNRPNCVNTAEGIPAPYGGCDATDSSGVLTYTRVEFSGIEFTPNNELNIITLNGVGNQTLIHHIQANAGGDDCIEWFGGTVNVKYFVSSGCADDQFDYQLGTTGARQYGLGIQYGPFLQT